MNLPSLLRRLRASLYSWPGSPFLHILAGRDAILAASLAPKRDLQSFVVLVRRGQRHRLGVIVGASGDVPFVG